MTLADLIVGLFLSYMFQTILDAGFRKAMKNVGPWASRVYSHEAIVKILGQIRMCEKPLKPVLVVEKKEEKKKEAPKPKAEAAAPVEKKLDNVQ